MVKLFYGSGTCNIEGADIRGVDIRFRGNIKITDKTSDKFVINFYKNRIIVFPIGEGYLNELFDYVGEFMALYVLAVNKNNDKVFTHIERSLDISEYISTKAEDMTIKTENMKAGYVHNSKISKTYLKNPTLDNLNTSNWNINLYYKNGEEYIGKFHIHLSDSSVMSGDTHDESSQLLYLRVGNSKLISTGMPNGVPSGFKMPFLRYKKKYSRRFPWRTKT